MITIEHWWFLIIWNHRHHRISAQMIQSDSVDCRLTQRGNVDTQQTMIGSHLSTQPQYWSANNNSHCHILQVSLRVSRFYRKHQKTKSTTQYVQHCLPPVTTCCFQHTLLHCDLELWPFHHNMWQSNNQSIYLENAGYQWDNCPLIWPPIHLSKNASAEIRLILSMTLR